MVDVAHAMEEQVGFVVLLSAACVGAAAFVPVRMFDLLDDSDTEMILVMMMMVVVVAAAAAGSEAVSATAHALKMVH